MITVQAERRPRTPRGGPGRRRSPEVSRVEVVDGTIRLWCARTEGMLPRIIDVAEAARHRGPRPLGDRADARDRLHRPHREGAPRMSESTDRPAGVAGHPGVAGRPSAGPRALAAASAWVAFRALLLRDLVVLRKNIKEFLPRTLLQPLLLVFVFAYVFPKIGQSVGGSGAAAQRVLDRARRRGRRARDHLPGHPVGRAADGAGVRVHPRDRGPRARAAAGRPRRHGEGRGRRAQRRCSARCSSSRSRRSCRPRRCTSRSAGRCCSRSRRSRA